MVVPVVRRVREVLEVQALVPGLVRLAATRSIWTCSYQVRVGQQDKEQTCLTSLTMMCYLHTYHQTQFSITGTTNSIGGKRCSTFSRFYEIAFYRFLARDAFLRTNRSDIAMMFVRLSVWDGRAL